MNENMPLRLLQHAIKKLYTYFLSFILFLTYFLTHKSVGYIH